MGKWVLSSLSCLDLLCSQLRNHRSALSILVHDLRDATLAEAYWTVDGDVVPSKIAQTIGDKHALQSSSSALFPAADFGGYVMDYFDWNEPGEYAADVGDDREMEERRGWGCQGAFKGTVEGFYNDGYVCI